MCRGVLLKSNDLLLNSVIARIVTHTQVKDCNHIVQACKPWVKEVSEFTEDMKKVLLTTGRWFPSEDVLVIHENIWNTPDKFLRTHAGCVGESLAYITFSHHISLKYSTF
jgi:hypothetical protein